jgi:hypothetical protein
MEAMSSRLRETSREIDPEAADVLRRFIEAIESGALMDSSPQDVVVVRHLQGALTDLESTPRRVGRKSGATR